MKQRIALLVLAAMVGCGGAGCRMFSSSRLASEVLWDRPFVENTVLPAVGEAADRRALVGSLKQFDFQLAEFYDFMRLVEAGTIKVTENSKDGMWNSVLARDGVRYWACYPGKRAPVNQFDKRVDRDPYTLIWGFVFHPSGRLRDASTLDWGFHFDEAGKLRSFWYATLTGEHFVVVNADGAVKSDFIEHPNPLVPAVKLIHSLLPTGWEVAATVDPAQFRPVLGLEKPVGQVTLTEPGRQLVWEAASGQRQAFQPNVILLVFPRRAAAAVSAAVAKHAASSRNPPVVFGWSRDYLFVTSPGYVNGGVNTADAQAAIQRLKDSLAVGITFE